MLRVCLLTLQATGMVSQSMDCCTGTEQTSWSNMYHNRVHAKLLPGGGK